MVPSSHPKPLAARARTAASGSYIAQVRPCGNANQLAAPTKNTESTSSSVPSTACLQSPAGGGSTAMSRPPSSNTRTVASGTRVCHASKRSSGRSGSSRTRRRRGTLSKIQPWKRAPAAANTVAPRNAVTASTGRPRNVPARTDPTTAPERPPSRTCRLPLFASTAAKPPSRPRTPPAKYAGSAAVSASPAPWPSASPSNPAIASHTAVNPAPRSNATRRPTHPRAAAGTDSSA